MGVVSPQQSSPGEEITAASINNPVNTLANAINGNLDDANISGLSGTKITTATVPGTALDSTARSGWITGLTAPSSITYNGNHSYSVVHPASILTYKSVGMRSRYTRTVTAPTQCTDLESGSSQYWSKTSPNKLSFTDDFTCMGWVKLESYTAGGIIARRNADTEGWSLSVNATGQVLLGAYRIAANNAVVSSYQSLPLNKWVHVAASYDLSGTTAAIYFDGVEVPSLKTVTGTCTALVQGTTALVVGAEKSAGTNPFDGKIAQAAVFSIVVSAATIRSYISQGLSGSETSLASAYSFNGVATDLNTTTPNDLSAQGSAVATNVDSPFAGGATQQSYTAGTTEFSETMAISADGLTETVRVPDGYALPTSGGVSASAYSNGHQPLGFPGVSNMLGYAQVMIDQGSITTETDLLGLTVTVDVPNGRKIKITGHVRSTNGTADAYNLFAIKEGSTGLQQGSANSRSGSASETVTMIYEGWPTAGSHTYKLMATGSGGTQTARASVLAPNFIEVELEPII